jgi:hypothetical protein
MRTSFQPKATGKPEGLHPPTNWVSAVMPPKHFSRHQDIALTICIRDHGTCPFGCGKDGAPNCHANVTGYGDRQCAPGRRAEEEVGDAIPS